MADDVRERADTAKVRIDHSIMEALDRIEGPGSPPGLAGAMRHAVLPGGARIRPRLTLSVAHACGEDNPAITDAAAAAIELMHCASLIHDDMPCFDNADTRRGKPTVHRAFGERLALLAGDALIVLAFESLAYGAVGAPNRLVAMVRVLGQSVGMPTGICAGQAWECEPHADLSAYHAAKTGSLFSGATVMGAAAAGFDDADAWRGFGDKLGEAYQVADDIRDVAGDAKKLGKPVGQDKALGRPNAALMIGLPKAVGRLDDLITQAIEAIPECPGRAALQRQVKAESMLFLPKKVWALVA